MPATNSLPLRLSLRLHGALSGSGRIAALCAAIASGCLAPAAALAQKPVAVWMTTADGSAQLQPQASVAWKKMPKDATGILINDKTTYQSMLGFGHALTGGSAQLLMKMSPAARHALLQELFGDGPNDIHTSYLRVTIGASDMNDHVYTYDDLPAGQTDTGLKQFSLTEDEKDVIPVLREILTIQPSLAILASPWTAPTWMKTNGAYKDGELKPEFYAAYAQYFVRYLQGMQAHGISISAVTPQNEPENPHNTPSMIMTAPEEAEFIGHDLGPALAASGLKAGGKKVEIIDFDHNCDHPIYTEAILGNPQAAAYTAGSGFHLYRGEISALTAVHDMFPKKDIYFTEQMVVPKRVRPHHAEPGGPASAQPAPDSPAPAQPAPDHSIAEPVARLIIGAPANWSRNVLLWNLAADPENGPHTSDGGCPVCTGALTLDGDHVTRLTAYYTAAHASKFVPPGSVRIGSGSANPEQAGGLAQVAFTTPQHRHVLIVSNPDLVEHPVDILYAGKRAQAVLPAGAVATYVW